MLKNYLIIAWRNFRKHKSFSLINSAGLAVGMACFILIMLYVQFELSFDRYHEKADRIYRIVAQQSGNVYLGSDHFAVTEAILGLLIPSINSFWTMNSIACASLKKSSARFLDTLPSRQFLLLA